MDDSLVGTEVDGYRVQEVIGQGGMGIVYRAEDVALSRPVALKCINRSLANDESFLRRFRSEARALAQIDSPYIVQVYTLAQLDVGLVIVMEYVPGQDLKASIDGTGTDWRRVVPLLRQMLTALEHAHGAHVIHRDIKPHNILLADGDTTHGNRIKMTDFGLAKINASGDRRRTVTEGVYGSVNYMSPEQVDGLGDIDHRSDLYSLGITAYELLAGRLPYPEEETTYTVMRAIVEEQLPPLSDFVDNVPPDVVDVVMRALEKDPGDRFQTATEMKEALNDVAPHSAQGPAPGSHTSFATASASPPTGERTAPSPGASQRSLGHDDRGAAASVSPHLGSAWPSLASWKTVGVVLLFVGILSGAGYIAYDRSLRPVPSRAQNAPAQSTPPRVPQSIATLVPITHAATLKKKIDERVERGTLIRGSSPQDFFISSTECYLFIVNRSTERVEAVLDTGAVRTDLRSGTRRPNWSERYADRQQIWVALSR